MTTELATPVIHLNGSSAESLLEGYGAAISAINSAIESVASAGGNARDYYVKGAQYWAKAQAEHGNRLASLRTVLEELEAIAECVSNQAIERGIQVRIKP